jgi:hypothetical protein
MTPLLGLSWTYHELTKSGTPKNDEEVHTITVDMDDNPHLDARTKARYLKGLSAEERAARKSGRFVHFAGLIFPEFSPEVHVLPEHNPPEGSTIVVGIDPGLRHMAAVV